MTPLQRAARQTVWGLIRGYQLTLSSVIGRHCRFQPSCSAYTQQAVQLHGVRKGLLLGGLRICRCGPPLFRGRFAYGPSNGFDPVPGLWQDALPDLFKMLKNKESSPQ